MARVKKSIPNLINGVSQQPPSLRFPTQCEEQLNAYSNVVDGLRKRPPSEHLAKIFDDPDQEVYVHTIDRDEANRHLAVFYNNDLKVFDFNGNEKTVNFPNGKTYLATPTPTTSFSATTVADYTFIVNKNTSVRVKDKYDSLTLVPIYENRWVLSFSRVPANSTSYDLSVSSRYRCTIGDRTVEEYPEVRKEDLGRRGSAWVNKSFHAEPSMQQYLSKVSTALNDVYGVTSQVIGQEIHVTTNSPKQITDASQRWTVSKSPHKDHWHVGNSVSAHTTLTGNSMRNVLIGYRSPNGDSIPPRAVVRKEAIVFVQTPDYSTTYTVRVGTQYFNYTTDATDRSTVNTEFIASQLKNAMDSNFYMTNNFNLTLDGSLIRLQAKSSSFDFEIEHRDSKGDNALRAIKEQVQDISDLPARCFDGFTVAVIGSGTADERYYVRYDKGASGNETGTWTETSAVGLNNILLADTMPHTLVAETNGTFTFKPASWAERKAGDLDTNPEPSFVNQTINDVFFWRNRLGILSGENLILSEDGDYWNFYPLTVRTTLDSSPIDIGTTADRVSILKQAVAFNEKLLIFSDRVQFTPNTGDTGILSARTISMDVATRFDALLIAKPVGSGQNVFFPVKLGNFSGVREYFVAPDTRVNNAADITAHVPTYIKGNIVDMAASSAQDIMVCRTDDARGTIYVYTFYWDGNQKIQSAWSRWEFGSDIVSMEFIESRLFLAVRRPEGLMLEVVDLSRFNRPVNVGFPTEVLLDRRTLVNVGDKKPTQFANSGASLRAVAKTGTLKDGSAVDDWYDTNGNATMEHYLGITYDFQFTFSEQVLTEGEQGVVNLLDRLQLQRMSLSYNQSGYFRVNVSAPYNTGAVHTFTAQILGSLNNILGRANLEDGLFKFPIKLNSKTATIQIQSDSHLPCSFQSAEWSGRSRPKARYTA